MVGAALAAAALAPATARAQTACTAISVTAAPYLMVTGDTFTSYTSASGTPPFDASPDGNSCSTVDTTAPGITQRGFTGVGSDAIFQFNRPVSRVYIYLQHVQLPGDELVIGEAGATATDAGCGGYYRIDFSTPSTRLTIRDTNAGGGSGYSVMLADCVTPRPPSAPVVTIRDGDNGLNATEIAAGVKVDIRIPSDAVAGNTLNVDTNNDGTADQVITLTAGQIGATVQITVVAGHVPANGVLTVRATVTNSVGPSAAGTDTSVTDSAPPLAPTVVIQDGNDGFLSAAELTGPVIVTLTVRPSVAGETLYVDTDGDGVADKSFVLVAADSGTTINYTVDAVDVPANGTLNVVAYVQDVAGNIGPSGRDSTVTDRIAPPAPTVVIQDGGDGVLSAAEIAAGVTVTLTVRPSFAGDVLSVDTDGDGLADKTFPLTSADAGTTFSYVVDAADVPANGTLTVTAHVNDPAGNVGPDAKDTALTDSRAPVAPVVTIEDGGDGELSEAETAGGVDVTIDLPVGTVAGDTLYIDTAGDARPEYSVVLTAGDVDGPYVITLDAAALPFGSLTVSASVTDAAGNPGPAGTDTSTIECLPQVDVCNGVDDDCDGNPDAGVSLEELLVSACEDTDNDGLSNYTEVLGSAPTDPNNPDTDGDGLQDGTEVGLTVSQSPKTNAAVFVIDADPDTVTDPNDDDSDDDGLLDGSEDVDADGELSGDETDPNDDDSDDDEVQDGTESGLADPEGDDTESTAFVPDADPATVTDPLVDDTDDGTLDDGVEDGNHNGEYEPDLGECDPNDGDDDLDCLDSDEDGLSDLFEDGNGTDPEDDDTDDDGLGDGTETNGETDPTNPDTDGDGLQDGTELGLTSPEGDDTDAATFVPDVDSGSTTDPNEGDTDGDGLKDGEEDANQNGAVEATETDPNNPDTDSGGINDGDEVARGTDPLDRADDVDEPDEPEQWIQGGCATTSTAPWLALTLIAGLLARRRTVRA